MGNDYPYLEFIKMAKDCRTALVEDLLEANSPDLYGALYCDIGSKIHEIKLELYEIQWLELHWKKLSESVENKKCSLPEKQKLISMYAEWYRDYVDRWNYTEFDAVIFEERKNILKALVSVNDGWEQELKRMEVSFEKNKKMLNEKIKILKAEE